MQISQLIASSAVEQVLAGQNLTRSLPAAIAQYPNATPQQKSAATDYSYGALRYYHELSWYLAQLLNKPMTDTRVEALLLVALYQLQYDEAKAFTVVNQIVNATLQLKKNWAKGFVNGVCRNFIRQQESLTEQAKADLSANYAYPKWWITKIKQQYPNHWESILNIGNSHPPMTLRLSAKQQTADAYLALLEGQSMSAQAINDEALILEKPVSVNALPEFATGVVSVQDYGAQLAAHALDLQADMQVLDACSAPGGKAVHCLALSDVKLTALDHDETRLAKVQQNLDRLQLAATVACGDAAKQDWWDRALYDRILADVPCSASGIVRRHVDMKCLRRPDDIERFAAQQAKILANLWQMLKKGGKLLYATCSIFEEENQRQIDQFLAQTNNAQLLPIPQLASNQFPKLLRQGNQLLPNAMHDGFFYALLQKV